MREDWKQVYYGLEKSIDHLRYFFTGQAGTTLPNIKFEYNCPDRRILKNSYAYLDVETRFKKGEPIERAHFELHGKSLGAYLVLPHDNWHLCLATLRIFGDFGNGKILNFSDDTPKDIVAKILEPTWENLQRLRTQ